ncbi:MAG: methionine--tRNA ligase [Actinomycetota bacterium]|jgi:methionyl-tRNA synthetase|nr:methionine--tRNA ligase [Actinomycetota bacterium]
MAEPAPAQKAFYVTTPIYYVNDTPHIGHAYTTVAADVLARWHRQRGEEVWFLTGTDEHGEKVMRAAQANEMTPQEWTDRLVASAWQPVLDVLDVSNDDFIRTTEQRHTERVREFWQRLHDAGDVYEGKYEGLYCVSCEEFKLPGELLDGEGGDRLCAVHGRPVETISEQNYFFRLSAYGDRLLQLYADNPGFVAPERARNEVVAFVEGGLQDLSITRSTFDWGIPVPWDEAHVLYVWIDALLNYLTAAGFETNPEKFAATWPADVHLVGKDILRFHAVIWPAMLMAAGLPVPRQVFAHGWLLVGGEKMSKTKLTGISPDSIVEHFGSDAFRYYFLRAIAFGSDGSFSWEHMEAVYTAELANGLGNLASRVTAMASRYVDGVLPRPAQPGDAERALQEALKDTVAAADEAVQRLAFSEAIGAVEAFVGAVNGYVSEQQPWQVAKDDSTQARARLATILYTAAESLRAVAVLYHPVLPKATASLWAALGAEPQLGALAAQRLDEAGRWGQLQAGARLTKGAALFPRLVEETTA